MDYEQTPPDQTTNPNASFELDNFNLNTNEWNLSTPEQSRRALGSSAIDHTQNSPEQSPALGQITPSFPPGYAPVESAPAPIDVATKTLSPEFFAVSTVRKKADTDQNLSLADARVIDFAVDNLGRNGNIADFYEQIRADVAEGGKQ